MEGDAAKNSLSDASSKVLDKYIRNIRAMNERSAYEYYTRLTTFHDYKITLDNLIIDLKPVVKIHTIF